MPDLNHSNKRNAKPSRLPPERDAPATVGGRRRYARKPRDFRCKKFAGRPSHIDGTCRTIELQHSMLKSNPQPGATPARWAINRYFELSLYLLVLMGFGALASTGGLGVATMLLV